MTNLLTRIKDIVMADLNETLQLKEKQNPIALLNRYLSQCEQETEKVGKLVGRQSQLKDEFSKEYSQAAELAEKRKYQAEIALKAGETELYRFASAEQQLYSERAERLKASLEQAAEQLKELTRKHEEMKHKLKDMQLRRMELMGRENVARATQRINKVIDANLSTNQFSYTFKDIENYLDSLEQKVTGLFKDGSIDARAAKLEKELTQQKDQSIDITKE